MLKARVISVKSDVALLVDAPDQSDISEVIATAVSSAVLSWKWLLPHLSVLGFAWFRPSLQPAHWIVHTTFCIVYTVHTTHCTVHIVHYPLHTAYCTQHTTNRTYHTAHFTLHNVHCTLPTPNCKLQTAHCTYHTTHRTLYTTHYTIYNIHYTLNTVHCSLHTAHYTLWTVWFRPDTGSQQEAPSSSLLQEVAAKRTIFTKLANSGHSRRTVAKPVYLTLF